MHKPKNIWRIYLLPHGDEHQKNEFGFCYQRNIIGIGWGVCRTPTDVDDYLEGVNAKYPEDPGGQEAAETISKKMSVGDLVWIRNHWNDPGRFCLGKITGDWDYQNDHENWCADIFSIRPCELHEVRAADAGEHADDFFEALGNRFKGFSTVQPVADADAKQRTIEIWDEIQNQIKPNR